MPRGSKKATYQANGNGNIKNLTDELFQAAIRLRGTIEPGDYKRYVLPIIFLRFLSLRYESRRAELDHMVKDQQSDYFGYVDALEDPDEYRSASVFPIPPEARWENIRRIANADDIKVKLDNILQLLEDAYPDKLKGLLPRIYAGSNLERQGLTGLINLFSKDIFEQDHDGIDLLGRVYEYFIGEFASSEGKRGGQYFTPASIVRLLVAMLEPTEGKVFDPCCGSGGMFVQSDQFTKHGGKLSFFGQESTEFTYRLCRMNLFIHGLNGNIEPGNSYTDDKHASLKADYVMANPPFNDGAKGDEGWGANRIPDKDPRLSIAGQKMTLAPRNANTMWMMHFLYHLAEHGTAGFVMSAGELSNSQKPRREVRRALVDAGYVDCIVQLSAKLFANTQIPCVLWFLSKNRNGGHGLRRRNDEILFVDARRLGALIPGSRKQRQLSSDEIQRVASIYRQFKRSGVPPEEPGFAKVAIRSEVADKRYSLTPGRYVGSQDVEDDDEPFEELMPKLVSRLKTQSDEAAALGSEIWSNLKELGLEPTMDDLQAG